MRPSYGRRRQWEHNHPSTRLECIVTDENTPSTHRLRSRKDSRQRTRPVHPAVAPFITRAIPPYEMLNEDQLVDIEKHADEILQEVGMEIRGDEPAIRLWRNAGADIEGESRVRVPIGLARQIIKRSSPAEFIQHSRNTARSVTIGGRATVFAPAYGPPFVCDADRGRRYGTLEDFRNFVKLAYMSPWLHHSGGTVCEPTDIPVNKRHLDMLYAHMTLSDKPFMGSVTTAPRAADSIEMCRILFGSEYVEHHCMALDENGFAMDAFREVGPGSHFLGSAHTLRNYETAFFDFELSDNNSFEQWSQEGAHDILWRANHKWKAMLDAYQPPSLDPGRNEALLAFIAERKASMPDTNY